ncbi:MAG: hypothetical protein IKL37_01280 [Alphaproteobacteria bacterium]|nr:hypothetical protein [Alphaproteobacteria bacterium]
MNPIYKFQLNRTTVNLLNPKTVVSGLLNTSNGQLTDSTIYQTSDFIPVTPGTNYKLCDADTFTSWAAAAACFYTENKTFISGSYGINNTPSNAAYLRVSYQGLNNGYGVFPSNVSSYSDYVTPIAYPVYKDDLAKDFEKESNQEFFRAKLSGKLTFQSLDYDFIVAQPFDFQFVLEIFISYDAGQTWTSYWRGTFWKTDCEFDNDAKTVVVQPTVWDQYNDILAGMDKEYNLIELAPEIVPVKADKRPMIQVYVPGQSVVGCFLSGMWWEQEAEPESDETKLVNDFKFSLNKVMTMADVSGSMSPQLPAFFNKTFPGDERFNPGTPGTTDFVGTEYTMRYYFYAGGGGATQRWQILRNSDSTVLWQKEWSGGTLPDITIPQTVVLTPVSGTGATGNVTLYVHDIAVYSRFVLDTPQISGLDTYPIPDDDIVENNRNYSRVIGYYFPDTIYFSTSLTSTPNQWGLYQPGQYYQPPYLYWSPELFPVARNAWGRVSIWFTFSAFDWIVEESGRQSFTIRHAYPLASVISVLLAKIAPNITHDATTDYSQFLYGTNLIGITQTLLITPKSNLVTAGYDQPAQKAPITLKNVTDMLRDCFRCYWFIDEQNRFRIEHIQYFRNGGSYSGSPVVGIDLTTQQVPRNGKAWAFARDQYKFDKPAMAARYQFGWMDDVTQLFDGFPIDIISKYVNPDNIEQIDVSRFTSDIDYILLNPGAISKDGFALLSATSKNELQSTITINLTSTNSVVINPVPAEWSGKTVQLQYSISTGSFNFRVYYNGTANYILSPTLTGSGIITLIFPNNVSRIYIESATVGATFNLFGVFIGNLYLPYYNYVINSNDHYLQNAYVAFCILQNYYAFDMPAPHYAINGVQMYAQGIKKLKNQTLRFPVLNDPDLVQLVKTNLGNGTIEKLSVNLSSRNANATLKYDTE